MREPRPSDFETEEEYQKALGQYDLYWEAKIDRAQEEKYENEERY